MNISNIVHRILQRVQLEPVKPESILSADEINAFIQLKHAAQKQNNKAYSDDKGLHGQKLTSRIGHGMDYAESRKYSTGDDIRAINWQQSARSSELVVNVFQQENEATDYILLDNRRGMYFATQCQPKISVALKALISLVLDSLHKNHDVRIVVLAGQLQIFELSSLNSAIPVFNRLGKFSEEILVRNGKHQSLLNAIRLLQSSKPRYSNINIISDFHDIDDEVSSLLNLLSETNLLYLVQVTDPVESDVPDFIPVEYQSMFDDTIIDLKNRTQLTEFQDYLHNLKTKIVSRLERSGARVVSLQTIVADSELVKI